jgi:hypothetical protein
VAADSKLPTAPASAQELDTFLRKLASIKPVQAADGQPGRLIFALDATGSRQPTWDRAAQITGEMFMATDSLGGLAIQLCCYRGFGEFKVAPWTTRSADLLRLMTSVTCRAGETQIGKVLQHTINETERERVAALVFVGDCMEENVDKLAALAGKLGLLGVPSFMFHEGNDPVAAFAFREVARLSGGACCRFDAGSAQQLRELLRAVAVYASGGRRALARLANEHGGAVKRLIRQMPDR